MHFKVVIAVYVLSLILLIYLKKAKERNNKEREKNNGDDYKNYSNIRIYVYQGHLHASTGLIYILFIQIEKTKSFCSG